MKQKLIQKKILFIVFLFIPLSYLYSQDIDPIQSKLENIADDIYLVTNIRGGNVAVLIGEDSTLVVDTGSSADDVERIQSAISELNDLPIHLVVNTHWHSDHVGGNEKMNELGALIIAHENVKKRMQKEQFLQFLDRTIPKASEKSLPHQTFTNN